MSKVHGEDLKRLVLDTAVAKHFKDQRLALSRLKTDLEIERKRLREED